MNAGTQRCHININDRNTPDIPKSSHAIVPSPFARYFWKMAEVYRADSLGDPIPFCSQGCL